MSVSVASIALIVAWWPTTTGVGAMSEATYNRLTLGERRTSIESRYGPPSSDMDTTFLPPIPLGQQCVVYSESEALQDPLIFRLCYLNGQLASKSEFESLHDPAPIQSSPDCVPVDLLIQGSGTNTKRVGVCVSDPALTR